MTTGAALPNLAPFELEAKLGSGSVGEVWRAHDHDRLAAVKLINEPDDPQQRRSLETEIRALGCLEHPAIPALYTFDLQSERPYIVMEYLEGAPFHRLIADGSIWHIPVDQRLTILDQIAQAVAHTHARGLVHRDIKPANIIGTEQPHLIDYGIAAEIGAAVTPAGTPFYMFPAVQSPTPAHDAFGFALTAYEFLFGVHALFTAQDGGLARDTIRALARQRLTEHTWRLPSRIAAYELPYDLRGVDLTALDALFASAFDWQAEPIIPLDLVAGLRALILTPENQPFMDALPQVSAPPKAEVATDPAGTATVHPEPTPRWRTTDMLLTSAIGLGAAVLLFIALQNAF